MGDCVCCVVCRSEYDQCFGMMVWGRCGGYDESVTVEGMSGVLLCGACSSPPHEETDR